MDEKTLPGPEEIGATDSLPPFTEEPGPAEAGLAEEPTSADTETPPSALAEETSAADPSIVMRGPVLQTSAAPFPPAAALLNLTGLGLGYLYLRRWIRWGIHLVVTLGLIVAAYLSGAASLPWLWLPIWGIWLAWMVVDGWLQAARLQRVAPKRPAGRWWLPIAIGWVAVVLVVGGVAAYLSFGQQEFDAGMEAYHAGDCRQAIQHMNWVTSFYELTLSANVATADRTIIECSLLVYAENQWQGAAYEEATAGYETYLDNYPRGGLVPLAREQVAEVYLDWGDALRQEAAYETAIETYQVVSQRYPQTASARDVPVLTAAAYAEWGAALEEEGEYAEAIARYDLILEQYPSTSSGQEAAAWAAEAYVLWAAELEEAGQYETAIAKYRTVLEQYPDAPAGRQSANLAAAAYETWAAKLRQQGEYAEALARYQVVQEDFPDAPVDTYGLMAETYQEWAAQLRQQGEYAEAVARYQVVQEDFPNAPVDAYTLMAETYWEWAAQLREDNDYETALNKYEVISSSYALVYAPTEVRLTMAETYGEWATYLRGQDLYGLALTQYETLRNRYADTPEGQQATAAILEMHWDWGHALWDSKGYGGAIDKFDYIIENYPDTSEAITATLNIGRIYNDWGKDLTLDRAYTAAMEKHRLAKEATDDDEVAAAAEAGYNGALDGLARDTTGEGKDLLNQVEENACEGEGTDSPAINLFTDQPGKAVYGGSLISLPDDLLATMPGHLRYVICSTSGTTVVERCPYSGGHTLIRQRRWWRIRVRSPLTGYVLYDKTFYGDYPSSCPFMYTFSGPTATKTGSSPERTTVLDWLRGIIR